MPPDRLSFLRRPTSRRTPTAVEFTYTTHHSILMDSSSSTPRAITGIVICCRPGFEKDAAAELTEYALIRGHAGYVTTTAESGFVVLNLDEECSFETINRNIRLAELIFARQLGFRFGTASHMPDDDRVSPIIELARCAPSRFSSITIETPDSDATKPLSGFCRRLSAPLGRAAEKANVLRPKRVHLPNLAILFIGQGEALLGINSADNRSPWPSGIPRLRMPKDAPSRSTQKLAEAFVTLLSDTELEQRLRPGQRAVDLGAAPGGWTWQLAWRGLRVTAVDNGPMAASVMKTEMVTHVRADGFKWRPPSAVEWMVCDMVEQPSRIAALVADWVASGRCRHAIFNLKLPMKRRHEEIGRCRELIGQRFAKAALSYRLRLKQLYHDREEITGFLEAIR